MSQGCIKPLCDLLVSGDNKIIQVALDGLENILKVGDMDKPQTGGMNQMALFIEECGGMDKISALQNHDNTEIYKKAYHIIDQYFSDDDEEEGLQPQIDQNTGAFAFNAEGMSVPQGGFSFGPQ